MRWMLLSLVFALPCYGQEVTVESLTRLRMQIHTATLEAMRAAADANERARQLRSDGSPQAGIAEKEAERARWHREQLESKLSEVERALRALKR